MQMMPKHVLWPSSTVLTCMLFEFHAVRVLWSYGKDSCHTMVAVRLAIHRLWVQALPWHHCTVVLNKRLTPVCLCHQAV